MTRLEKTLLTVQIVIIVAMAAFLVYHAVQYAHIRIYFGCDAPFEDWTTFAAEYYRINEWVDLFRTFVLG